MLPVSYEDNNQHYDEEKQYEPDPSMSDRDHERASLSYWEPTFREQLQETTNTPEE